MVSRRRAWADTRLAGTQLTAGTAVNVDLLADAPVLDTLTAVRIVCDLTVMYNVAATVVDSLSIVDLGIGVAAASAFAVSGALPAPQLTTEYPPRGWLYVGSKPVAQSASTDGVTNTMARFEFDIRSMRKIDKGTLFLTMIQADIITGGSMQVVGRVRVLCLT